ADVIDTCPPAFDQYSLCGEFGNLPTYFAGDCYIDQTVQLVENRSIFAAGCLDSNSFPNPQEGFIDADQNCCPEVAALAPQCATDFWDATCASYANSPLLVGSCLQAGTECAAPFGPVRLEAQQPKMNFAGDCPDPVAPFDVNCWPFNPAIQYFAPQLTTPNYYKMGLQPWSTDEVISYNDWGLAVPNALRELLPWPMGGATIQSTSYTIVDDPAAPGGPFIAQTMWGGQGLNLHAKDPNASQGGMNSADRYSGLYGLGELHQDLSGVPNGTFGGGVTIAVLDYAAFLQQYSTSDGQGGLFWWGAVHEELTNIKLEGTHTTHDYVEMVFDPAAPFRFSADHGSAVLGVIAGSWDTNDADSNTGIQGIVPESEVIFFPLVGRDANGLAQGRSGTAWINAMLSLDPGDILAATYSASSGNGGGINNLDYNPDTHDKITLATALGISVVIAAGNLGVDLLDIDTPDGQDSGAIVVAAVSPGANRLFLEDTDFDDDYADADANRRKNWKRWADGTRGSNFTTSIDFSKITVAGWGTGITTCGMGTNRDNWLGYQTVAYPNGCNYNEVAAKSYTNNFGRTSAAAAMAVGCIAGMQGYSIQVFGSPLSPLFTRLYIGGGSYVGITPTDPDVPGSGGAPILSFPLSINLTTENDLTHADPPPEPWTTWDWVLDQDGIGNLTGNFLDPWTSCQQVLADPIFDTPGIDNDIMVLRGDYHMGNSTSIAAQDNMYFSVVPEHTFVGDYSMPSDYTGPGDHVTYLSTAFVTDIYLTGQLRGGLSPGNILEWNLLLRDAEFTSTILLVYMWDYSRRTWVQASTSEVLGPDDVNADGLIDVQFIVPRSSRMIDRLDRYHARFVTVTQDDGDNQLFPFMYDQIRVSSGSMPGPISMP
ncbi:MAG: S8 family serine peptidase, partial [Phycisphaerales bacterium]|nr:S8 family serine peptidase [Phycisphaerales bacterium]